MDRTKKKTQKKKKNYFYFVLQDWVSMPLFN